jgi:transcriptional regulator with XRE-family HTH domain
MNGGALKLDRDRLQRAREMLGYGLEKTAEEAGISKNSVLRAEHEEDIRPGTARKIAGALHVSVADLIGEKVVTGSMHARVDAQTFAILVTVLTGEVYEVIDKLADGELSPEEAKEEAKERFGRVLEPALQ